MLEDERKLTNQINPESLDPNHVSRPAVTEDKSDDYEDTPEFRKSLNMKVSPLRCIALSCQIVDIEYAEDQQSLFRCHCISLQPIVLSTHGHCMHRRSTIEKVTHVWAVQALIHRHATSDLEVVTYWLPFCNSVSGGSNRFPSSTLY